MKVVSEVCMSVEVRKQCWQMHSITYIGLVTCAGTLLTVCEYLKLPDLLNASTS